METKSFKPQEGGCTCAQVRYTLLQAPMIVHCCHCTWCQRETGSSFALNALVEAAAVQLMRGTPKLVNTPSNSGYGQEIMRCPSCEVALWSHYSAARRAVSFVRIGTLDHPGLFPPDIHIFTAAKQPWIELNDSIPSVDGYYRRSEVWPAASMERYQRALGK